MVKLPGFGKTAQIPLVQEAKPLPPPISPKASRKALTAAVARIEMEGSWKSFRFGDRAWQSDAWRLYDITGQLRFVSNWVGNCLSRCVLRVHEVDEQGNIGAIVDDPEIAQFGSGPLGVGDARAEALRLCGIDLFVTGEAFLIAEAEGGPDGSDLWWVVTGSQIKKQGDLITIPRSPMHGGGTFTYRNGTDLILRLWTPHPKDTNEPDSSTRSAIPDLRKMEAIRKREFAELDSRLTGAGVLLLPDSLDLPRGPDDPDGPDGFASLLMRTMATSLRDRSSSESMVPIIVQGNAVDLDKVKHMTFWSPLSDQLTAMWQNALIGLAESLDVPPEVMTGMGGSNHWSAWMISDSAVTEQIKPIASRVASALTIGYLWPGLEGRGIDVVTKYAYQFDTALLTARPNRSSDAMVYHNAGLISDDVARNAGAWAEDDAPSPEEQARRLARELLLSNPSIALADPGIRQLLALPGIGNPQTTETTTNQETKPEIPENQIPATLPTGTNPENQKPPPTMSGLNVAIALTARRAMSLAGRKLISHRDRSRYPNIPDHQLSAKYGPVNPNQVDTLIEKAWADLDIIAENYKVSRTALSELLTEFCRELLVRGIAYGDDMVENLLSAPEVTRRLRKQP